MLAAALPAPAAVPPVADVAVRPVCSPCAYSAHNRRRAARLRRRARHELELVRWYMRRHRATRGYRGWLASTRACESGGRYGTNTGNGFFGAYQFTLSSWRAVGGRGYPHLAPPLEQDYRAVRLLHLQGAGAWPVCG
jgi:hypothetical protein